MLKFR